MPASSDRVPALHVLVSESELEDPAKLDITRELVESGPRVAVHLRARVAVVDLFRIARELGERARASGGWCVVNGRPDVALAASSQAVQLGRTALSVPETRRVLGPDSGVRIGVSVHEAWEAQVAAEEGASYLVAGTAYATPSHPEADGIGPQGIGDIVTAAGPAVPVLAIGGVDRTRIGQLVAVGAVGVVVGRAVWGARDPMLAVRALTDVLAQGLEE